MRLFLAAASANSPAMASIAFANRCRNGQSIRAAAKSLYFSRAAEPMPEFPARLRCALHPAWC
jgi:hypothetical protein